MWPGVVMVCVGVRIEHSRLTLDHRTFEPPELRKNNRPKFKTSDKCPNLNG